MNTAILYSKHEDITEKAFIIKIRTVSQLLSPGGSLSLICFDGEENIQRILKKAAQKNDVVFFTEQIVSDNSLFFAKILKGSSFGYYKKSITAVLPTADNKFFDTVAHILCCCSGDGNSYAFDYVDISEKSLEDTVAIISAECLFSNPKLYAIEFENLVRILIVAESDTQSSADILCGETVQNLKMLFGDNAFSNHFEDITATVVELLNRHNLKVATAESCTAGMLSSAITSVPGASAVFEIGISSYADRIKKAALGVSAATLKKYGAVSMQTAVEMARGIKLLSDADIGVSATGVAGPGCSEYKPVGTVYIALTDGKRNWVIDLNLDSSLSRDEIRSKTTFACLDLLRRYLQCLPSVLPDGTEIDAPLFLLYEQPHFEPQLAAMSDAVSESAEEDDILSIDQIGFTVNQNIFDNEDITEEKSTVNLNFDIKTIVEKVKSFVTYAYLKCKEILSDTQRIKKIVANSVFAVIITSMLLGSLSVYAYFNASNKNQELTQDLRANWNYTGAIDANGNFADFNKLSSINNDISGWLTIGDGTVDLPVCQTDNEDYYKNHNYKKQSSRYGALYFGGNVKPADNTVIYGNSPADSSMFAPLKNYRSVEFLRENTNIELITKYSRRLYQVFAVMIIDSENTDGFDCTVTDFTDSAAFNEWIGEVSIRSLYKSDASLPESYDTITLITDTDEFDGAKLVVVGYSVNRFDESYPISLKVNSAPYYPNAWYDTHKEVNPYSDSKPTPDWPTETPEEPPLVIVPGITDDTPSDTPSEPIESTPDNTVSTPTGNTTSGSTTSGNTSSSTTSSNTSSSATGSGDTSSSASSSESTSSNTTSDGNTSSDVTSDTSSDTTASDTSSDN